MTLLNVRSLGKSFGGVRAVDGIDFDIAPGELLALVGPNGAGKTTTFNMVTGQLPASSGSVRLAGKELLGLSSRRIAQMGVGRTFQVAATFGSLTVIENVQTALLAHARQVFSFWRRAGSCHRDTALALLDYVDMRDHAQRPASELAYGDVKRVELALSLASAPRLLLMDEPTAGMAPRERHGLMALVRRLAVERELAVLFTEHSMDVVFGYADRVVVVARGRVVAQGTPVEIRENAFAREVYFGPVGLVSGARP